MNVPQHVPVLLDEVLEALQPQPGQVIVDGTLGGGGHTRALAERVGPKGLVIALDRDPAALAAAEVNLAGLPVVLSQSNFAEIPELLEELNEDFNKDFNITQVDGILLDLGWSSDQMADDERGFSFDSPGPPDMRFDTSRGQPASWYLNNARENTLADLIYQLGEERLSRRVARAIVAARPIESSRQLAEVVRRVVPKSPKSRIDSATRTFQALRIAVNEELKSLEIILRRAADVLRPGGRLAIISFHSLEDRRVKDAFRDDDRYEIVTRRPIQATAEEIQRNPRARSAKLRVACRRAART